MRFKVHMLAFYEEGDKIRKVKVPCDAEKMLNGEYTADKLLELVFKYGQNDFQPQQVYSVSVGDVIEMHEGLYYIVEAFGFKKISQGTLEMLKGMTREKRQKWMMENCYGT